MVGGGFCGGSEFRGWIPAFAGMTVSLWYARGDRTPELEQQNVAYVRGLTVAVVEELFCGLDVAI